MAIKKATKRKDSGSDVQASVAPLYEVIAIEGHCVACDGGKGALGHPRVFLEIPPTKNDVTCPYCSRTFICAHH